MSAHTAAQPSAQHESELAAWEAELNRREAALRRAEEMTNGPMSNEVSERLADIERREYELDRALAAVEAQRGRLEAARTEYDMRRESLAERSREVELERNRLCDEHALLAAARAELRERTPEPDDGEVAAEPDLDVRWWSKQLGAPLGSSELRPSKRRLQTFAETHW